MKNLRIKNGLILVCIMLFVQAKAQWIETLPQDVQDGIIWKADHEDNDLCEWTMCGYQYPGGSLQLNEPDEVTVEPSTNVAHSGNYSVLTQITNTCRRETPMHAVRLMRSTNTAWDNGGEAFPTQAYYSTWMYLPHVYNANTYEDWDPRYPDNDGWWNVFQFKSRRDGASKPVFTFNIAHDDDNDEMYFYMASKENYPRTYEQDEYKPIPARQWVHLEAYYEHSDSRTPNGQIKFWQDGELIFELDDVVTFLDEKFVFAVGNYTHHVDGPEGCGTATIYYDDVIVGTEPIHPHIDDTVTPPPPPPTECELIGNGDFSDNANQWSDWNCEIELQNGEALIDISTDRAGIKKGNSTLTFEQGKTYNITFDARAQSSRNMKVRATLDYAPYTKYFEEEVRLTTSMKSFEMTFTMGQYSPDSALEFNFYGNMSNVILDNVQVSEEDCGETPPPPPPTECDLIDDGDFSDEINAWSDWNCEIELQNGEALIDISTDRAGIKKGNGTLTFTEGKTYRINFDARAQSGRNMKVRATLDEAPYTKYFEEEVTLTTSMESFEMTFIMDQYSSASALEFNFYGHESNVILDNVQVTELDCEARYDVYEATSFQATAYPNPFNGQTQLEYELFRDANVEINVYNAMGQLIDSPVTAQAQFAGTHRIYFGENMLTGIYFCELKIDDANKIIKIVKSK